MKCWHTVPCNSWNLKLFCLRHFLWISWSAKYFLARSLEKVKTIYKRVSGKAVNEHLELPSEIWFVSSFNFIQYVYTFAINYFISPVLTAVYFAFVRTVELYYTAPTFFLKSIPNSSYCSSIGLCALHWQFSIYTTRRHVRVWTYSFMNY